MSDHDVLTRVCMMAATFEREAARVAFQRSDLYGYQQHSANASLLTSLAKGLSIAQVEPQEKVPDVGKEGVVSEWPGPDGRTVNRSEPPPLGIEDPYTWSDRVAAEERQAEQAADDPVPIIKGHKVYKRGEPPRRRPATVPVDASVPPNQRDAEE